VTAEVRYINQPPVARRKRPGARMAAAIPTVAKNSLRQPANRPMQTGPASSAIAQEPQRIGRSSPPGTDALTPAATVGPDRLGSPGSRHTRRRAAPRPQPEDRGTSRLRCPRRRAHPARALRPGIHAGVRSAWVMSGVPGFRAAGRRARSRAQLRRLGTAPTPAAVVPGELHPPLVGSAQRPPAGSRDGWWP
jgi:hypothetical protein